MKQRATMMERVQVRVIKKRRADREVIKDYKTEKLFDADPNCKHEVVALWSGVKCRKCTGWFCL